MNKYILWYTRDKFWKVVKRTIWEIAWTIHTSSWTGNNTDQFVLVFPKSTSTQLKSINPTSQIISPMETSPKSTPQLFPTSIVSFEDSLAKLLVSLESVEALKIPEERSSLNLREYCEQSNLDYSSLRMLKDCSVTTTEKLSQPLSPRLMSWGMTVNGKCLTARITECHKTGSESSLSDILEDQPDPKYFLSLEQTQKLWNSLSHEVQVWECMQKKV